MLSGVSIDLNVQYYHPVPAYVPCLPIHDTPVSLRQGWEAKGLIGRGTRLQIKCEILRCTTTLANIRCDVSLLLDNPITVVLPLDIQVLKEMITLTIKAVNADTGQVMFSGTHLKSWKAGKEPQNQDLPISKALAKL